MSTIAKSVCFLALLLVGSAFAQDKLLSPQEFTERYVEAVRKALPTATVTITGELEVRIQTEQGVDQAYNLLRPYTDYKTQPDKLDDLIRVWVAGAVEVAGWVTDTPSGLEQIIPLVRGREYELVKVPAEGGGSADSIKALVTQSLVGDLTIVYAYDNKSTFSFLTEKEFSKMGLAPDLLLAMALDNLNRILPEITALPMEGGSYMLTAGGDYEASLLLLDDLWDSGSLPQVDGELIMAVPARDVVVFTGSNEANAVSGLRNLLNNAEQYFHPIISRRLYVRRHHQWELYEPDSTATSDDN